MPSAKGQTYARSLDLVRRAALWDRKAPITPKGQIVSSSQTSADAGALTWEELGRKFLKHNPERGATAEAAQADQVVHSLLSRAAHEASEDDAIHLRDDPERGRVYMPPLVRDSDRGSAEWALEKVENAAKDVSQGGRGTGSEQDRNSATIVQALVHYALGEFSQCVGTLDQANTHVPDRVEEGYDLALLVMASALRGLSQEREGALSSALDQYKATIKVYDACLAQIKGSDNRNEEMHSWAEEVMYRHALLSRTQMNEQESLEAHRAYMFHSRYWPNSFRLNKRASFLASYLQLLYLTARRGSYRPARPDPQQQDGAPPGSASTTKSFSSQQGGGGAAPSWRQEVLSVQRAYESILRRTTKFPAAGSVNAPMLEFCDLAVEGWEIGGKRGEDAEEVVEMLYRATTLTFQSQRILRHLVELLSAKGAYEEAGRALKLYVQLFQRAKETGAGEAEKQIKDSRKNADKDEEKFAGDEKGIDEPEKGPGGDWDSDEQFVATLVFGVRLLVKHLDEPKLAGEMAEMAAETVEEDEGRFGDKLRARVERMRGIAFGAQAEKADRETRPQLQTKYLSHLTRAVRLDETSFENLYHLAYAQAELRQVGESIKTARKAVEVAPTSKQAWHLLALLVTAQRDLRMALDVIDSGLADSDSSEGGDGASNKILSGPKTEEPKVNGAGATPRPRYESRATESSEEFEDAAEESHNNSEGDLLRTPRAGNTKSDSVQQQIQSLSTAVSGGEQRKGRAAKLEFTQTKADDLEATVQLRMTRNVIIESIEGSEAALQDQQTLFIFFSQIASLIKTKVPAKKYNQPAPVKPSAPPPDNTQIASRNPSIIKSLGRRSTSGASQPNGAPAGKSHQRGASVSSNISALGVASNDVQEEDPEQTREAQRALRARSDALLQSLWLMSAATFRRWGKQQECKGAIQEAEALNADQAEVWVQFGLFALSSGDLPGTVNCLRKALVYTHDYIPAVIHLARLFIEEGSVELAEGLLDVATQTNGWDVPEAWFLLGQVLEKTRRQQRSRECLLYALQLEETKPIRPLVLSIPRVL